MKKWVTKSGQKLIQVLSGRSNVFLLTNGIKNILIDTSPKFMWRLLEKRFNTLNINNIDFLILTHSHFDHAGNARRIKEKYKPLVLIHTNEASNLTSGENTVPKGTSFFASLLVTLLAKLFAPQLKSDPCAGDIMIETFFDLKEFGFNAFLMHTPGHTPGSVSLIIDNEIALVGDTMVGLLKWSVFPPFAYDTEKLLISWKQLLETDCSIFIPSHGTANCRSLLQKTFNRKIKRFDK